VSRCYLSEVDREDPGRPLPQPPARARPGDEDVRHSAVPGVTMMKDEDLDGAVAVFQQIEQKDPDSPVGYVLEADANRMVPGTISPEPFPPTFLTRLPSLIVRC